MWLVGVVIRRYIDILIIIINFPYPTCIRSFFGSSILTSLFIFNNTYITYAPTFNYYYFPPGSRPAHAHIKGGWPGPDTIHNGGHIQKKKLSGVNARAFRMRYSAFTENNGILHLSAHVYDQRYIYVYGTVRSLWLDKVAYPIWSGALSRTRRHFQTRVRFRHALFR